MCNNQNTTVPSVTLQAAVLNEVTEFAKQNKPFSVFDVTTKLREKCNNGELEIPEVDNGANTGYRYNIRHDSVKAAFAELWDNVLQTGVPAFTRQFSGRYFVYEVDPNSTTSATPVITAPSNNTQVAPTPNGWVPNPVQLSDVEVTRRIRIYLSNCANIGKVPTPKQVQSAIKRDRSTGYNYDKIISVAKQLGFTLDVNV